MDKVDTVIETELKHCFDYFYENFNREENVYGLMPDAVPNLKGWSSIAGMGFMLVVMMIGETEGYLSKEEAQQICEKTLITCRKLQTDNGMYYHFYDSQTGERYHSSEISIIDTALFIAGALTVGAHYGGEVKRISEEIYSLCNWESFYSHQRKMFYMSKDEKGFHGYWDSYAEQLIVYFLSAGSEMGKEIANEAYYAFERLKGKYHAEEFLYSWYGSLFTHQFSHAFLDLRNIKDKDGVNWYDNSVRATREHIKFCQDTLVKFEGLSENEWGLTACDSPKGYNGRIGSAPSGRGGSTMHECDGTITPCGAIGSIVFTPNESIKAMETFYKRPALVGQYGLKDAYNAQQNWYSSKYISIDKGITALMIANYKRETVWKAFSKVSAIKRAIKVLEFSKENNNTKYSNKEKD